MKGSAGVLIFAFWLTPYAAHAQVARSFPSGSPVADKTNLLKIYTNIETQVPKWKAEAEAMQPVPEDSYALGRAVEITRSDLLKALNDLRDTLDAAQNEDFRNPWEVAFIECRVNDDLEQISASFDLYNATLALGSSAPKESGKTLLPQLKDIQTYSTTSRVLRIDLENRLHDMAVRTEKKP